VTEAAGGHTSTRGRREEILSPILDGTSLRAAAAPFGRLRGDRTWGISIQSLVKPVEHSRVCRNGPACPVHVNGKGLLVCAS
jgi:hypothetical protein